MNCNQTEQVSLLIDGELPPLERTRVKEHLVECADCHAAQESFLFLRSQINNYTGNVDAPAVAAALAKILPQRDVYAAPVASRN
ncbi:MAG TPA: zf-HC2 domain-containing protein, partial [Pyrinomonadaceae bacterium]|nr:zf-HC2 domain-containing protein [Pyrinomonadaceae bacterium]